MKLPTLYKLAVTGKTQQWTMEVEEDHFRSISGDVGGKLTTNEWTFCKGKNLSKANATTGATQALKEAQAKWTKKKNEGYTENIKDVKKAAVFAVMLAHNYDDYKDVIDPKETPVYSQPKLDGIRCRIDRDGLWTRYNKPILSCPHIFESVKHLLDDKQIKNDCLDGELYSHEHKHNFNRICELVKRQKCNAAELASSAKLIKFWCYDLTLPKTPFKERTKLIAELGTGNPNLVVVPTSLVKDKNHLDELYEHYMKLGFEGQMIRMADSVYENKRSKNLLKRKEFKDAEWKILGVVEGDGNRAGTAGYMEFKNKDGKPFRSNIKGDFEYLAELLKNKEELIGKEATIKYFNLTPDGIPRFGYVVAIRDYE